MQPVVALPGDGRGGGRERRARRALAGVVGLELVDVLGERARRLDAGLQALEQARLAGEAIELAGEVAGVETVEEQAVDLVAHGLAQAAEARGDERHAAGQALGRHQRRAVPPQGGHHGDVDTGEQLGQLGGAEGAAQLDHAARVGGAQLAGEALVDLAVDEDAQLAAGALGGLDQQLGALVRVGGAEEGDGQALAAATGTPVAAQALPDLVGGGDGLLDDVDHLGRVVLAGQGAAHRVGDGEAHRDPAREAVADALQALLVASGVVRSADARGAVAAAVAGAAADRAGAGEQVGARADEPVVVGREVARQAARRGLVDERSAEVVQVVEVHDVGAHAVQQRAEGLRDGRVVELAQRVAEVPQAVLAVVDGDQVHAVLVGLAHGIGLAGGIGTRGGVEDGDVPAAARELLGRHARDGRAAARVVEAERGEDDLAAVGAWARRGGHARGAIAQLAGQAGQRQDAMLQGVGQQLERPALGGVGMHDAPVELGHELAQGRGGDQRAQRVLHLLDLEGLGGLVGEVVAVAAQADERPAGHVAEAEAAHRAQPEVEVLGEAEVAAVAADGLVDAAVDHARRVDERVVLAHQMAQQLVAGAVPARPRAALHALAVDDRRRAVGHAGVGVAVEDRDLAGDAVGLADVVVAEHGDELAAALADDRVVGLGDPAV